MSRITSRVEVYVDGDLMLSKQGPIARGIGTGEQPNVELEPVMGDTGLHGFAENPIMAECEFNVTDREDIMLKDIAAQRDTTLVYRTAGGGKVYTMYNATCLRNLELTGGQGETRVRFAGPAWVETTSSN